MKKERYIVEIEMPNGDGASSTYIHDVIQSDCDIEDEGRWKVSVKEYWKPSEEQLKWFGDILGYHNFSSEGQKIMEEIYEQLKQL